MHAALEANNGTGASSRRLSYILYNVWIVATDIGDELMKKAIKRVLVKCGLMSKGGKKPRSANQAAGSSKKHRTPFAQKVYVPQWRFKNYLAMKEFGEEHKRWFIEQRYLHMIGHFPDLDDPKLFNEKLHWLNLNYENPLITRCCDKFELKRYVSEVVGSQYTVPTLRTYSRANEIDFDELPDRFAIKVNWGDGIEFSVVVSDKKKANIDLIKGKMANAMQPWNNLYYSHFFWGYKNVKPVIFAEEYLDAGEEDIKDYKIHCFNGEPKIVLVCEDRQSGKLHKTFLDVDWKLLPCRRADGEVNPNVEKPENYDEMIDVARALARPFPFVRVDFYSLNGRLYVGEMTFHPGCGFEKFIPEEWDRIVGDMLVLPEKNN